MYNTDPAIKTVLGLLNSVIDDVLTPARKRKKIKAAGSIMKDVGKREKENELKRNLKSRRPH